MNKPIKTLKEKLFLASLPQAEAVYKRSFKILSETLKKTIRLPYPASATSTGGAQDT
jgi:hypothetical protein